MTVTLVNAAETANAKNQVRIQPDARLVSLLKPDSFESDQYRMLRYAVERACPSTGCRVIAVTSAVPGDGKTLTAVNLAGAIARGGQSRVLLIDGDLRRPTVAQILGRSGVHRGWGFVDAILDPSLTLSQIVWQVEEFNLSVITSRRPQLDTYELLSSDRFGVLIGAARQEFDYVVIDTPPVLPAPDSRLIAPSIDGYLVVVAADKTPRKLVGETLALLGPAKVLGLVFNRESLKNSGYSRYYYAYSARTGSSK